MIPRLPTRGHRLTVTLALALMLAVPLPAAHAARKKPRGCANILDASSSGQRTVPLAIDARVFDGTMKGLVGPSDIMLSTRLANVAWTGFLDNVSAATVKAYIADPSRIPSLGLADVITLTHAVYALDFRLLAKKWPSGSVVVLPVVRADATVAGFATVTVGKIAARGNPKYLQGTLVSVALGPDSTVPACLPAP